MNLTNHQSDQLENKCHWTEFGWLGPVPLVTVEGVITTRQDRVQKQKDSAASEDERERHAWLAQFHGTECTLTGLPLKSRRARTRI
jgi:hypothetical protein